MSIHSRQAVPALKLGSASCLSLLASSAPRCRSTCLCQKARTDHLPRHHRLPCARPSPALHCRGHGATDPDSSRGSKKGTRQGIQCQQANTNYSSLPASRRQAACLLALLLTWRPQIAAASALPAVFDKAWQVCDPHMRLAPALLRSQEPVLGP